MATAPHIVIVGAGIGGLTAALALLRHGIDVTVCEQAAELGEVGAGVQISANGTRVLWQLGLGPALEAVAWRPEGKVIRLWNTGQSWPLFDLGVESEARYGFPYLMFHRADLHGVLAAAVRDAKPDAIKLGAACTSISQTDTTATAHLASGGSVAGDILIGADGIHSVVRRALFGGDASAPTGLMAWRGIVDVDRLPAGLLPPVGANWVGPGGHVVHYFLRRGELLNFVALREGSDWGIESWSSEGTIEECLADFAGWHETVHTLIRNLRQPYKWALFTREPMTRWSCGRASLLGDACHPMLPMLAQGAVMAIEDGIVLARAIAAHDDAAHALGAYEAARRDRTARAVRGSAENLSRFHAQSLADAAAAQAFVEQQWDADAIAARYEWLFDYDATTVAVEP